MFQHPVLVVLAFAASQATAQTSGRPESASLPNAGRPVAYDSAFKGYRPFVDPELSRWREANDEMGRLNGHVGHLPGSVPPRGASGSAKPPAHAGHGGAK